jgi:hypothetical protein
MSNSRYDVYAHKNDRDLRIAVPHGAGLPAHVVASEWELMQPGSSQIIEEADEDIEARGFCFFKLVRSSE